MRIRLIFCLFLLLLTVTTCSAYVYEVHQGDTVYLGEIVDVSRVMSWSGQFAYFTDGELSDYPDKIIKVPDGRDKYNHYLSSTKYNIGTWYKWDGKKEPAGNMVAFTIAPGSRNYTYISELDVTPAILPPSPTISPKKEPRDTHLLLARGDVGTMEYTVPKEHKDNPQAYFWLFGTIPDYDLTKGSLMTSGTILGEQMNYSHAGSLNSFTFTHEISQGLQEGWYSGYIQFVGKNGRQDVFYSADHQVDDNRYQVLDTLYDDTLIPDVPIDGFIPFRVQQEFEKLVQNEYSDDMVIPISVEVVTPSITIGDYWDEGSTIVIRGSTPMSAGTMISFMIDPDNYALLSDIKSHTFRTIAEYRDAGDSEAECITTYTDLNNDGYNVSVYNGTAYNITNINGTHFNGVILPPNIGSKTKCTSIPRTYTISIPLNWDELSIGHHTIEATIDTYGIYVKSTKDFDITGAWVNPEPTKEYNKVLVVREGDSHQASINGSTNTSSPVDNVTGSITTPDPTPTVTSEVIIIGNPPGDTIPVKTTPIPQPPEKQPDNNWFLWVLALIAIVGCFVYWLYNG